MMIKIFAMSSYSTRLSTILVLQSSDEGKVWWEDLQNLSHLKLATEDMSDMLRVFLEDDLSEFFYFKDGDDWLYDLK